MIDTKAYRSTLDRLEHDLAEAEAHVTNLRAAVTAIRGLIETETPKTSKASASTARVYERNPRLATATMEQAAEIALETTKEAMRVRDIWDVLSAMGYRYPKGFSVFRGSLTPTLDRRPQFTKVGKGLYALTRYANGNGSTPHSAAESAA